jgi:hypothetical protein
MMRLSHAPAVEAAVRRRQLLFHAGDIQGLAEEGGMSPDTIADAPDLAEFEGLFHEIRGPIEHQ